MGRFISGINGPVVGKVGNIIGSSWRGIHYIKSQGLRTKPPTEGEKLNRFIFKMTQSWLQPINAFVRVGFNGYSLKSQGIHAAKSYLHKNALMKNGYDTTIDPSLMKVSFGTLPLSEDMQVEFNDKREFVFTWNPVIGKGMDWRDQVMLMAYNVDEEDAEMVIAGQFRGVGGDKTESIGTDSGVYHIYAAFVSSDRERQSDSIYLGEIVVEKAKPKKTEASKEKIQPSTKGEVAEGSNELETSMLGEETVLSQGAAEGDNDLKTSEPARKMHVPQSIVKVDNGLEMSKSDKEVGLAQDIVEKGNELVTSKSDKGVGLLQNIVEGNNDLKSSESARKTEQPQSIGKGNNGLETSKSDKEINETSFDEKISPLKRTFISIFSRRSIRKNKRFKR